jgi:uncharacterized protein
MLKKTSFRLVLAFLFLIPSFAVKAQMNVELINSDKILGEANFYYYLGRYSKAISLYEKVGRNDTNYALVLRNLCYSYIEEKEDSLCARASMRGLALNSKFEPDFYYSLGNSLKEMSKFDSAHKVFDEGMKKYPNSFTLIYQKGMVFYKQKKYTEAIDCFQKTLVLNPYHSDSHFQIGKICAEQGRLVPAVLAYEYYLMLDSKTERAQKVTSALEDLYSGEYQPDPDMKLDDDESGDKCFGDIRDLIESKVALSPTYKTKCKINLKIVKHLQAVLEKLHYESGTNNWWMEYYVPFFIELQKQDYVVPFTCLSLYSVASNNPSVAKNIRKNKKKIAAFAKWAVKYIQDNLKHPERDRFTDKDKLSVILHENNMIAGVGHENATEKPIGTWYYFFEKGGRLMLQGNFNDMGKREGEWKWFYNDGTLKELTRYENGLRQGVSELYHPNGKVQYKFSYKEDEMEGEFTGYKLHGGINETATMKAGKLDGPAKLYFADGTIRAELEYKLGKMNGELRQYTIDGKIYSKSTQLNDKSNGPASQYFPSGKTDNEGAYKNDERFGPWKFYWGNGKLRMEGAYKDKGLRDGIWKKYYRDGTLEAELSYKLGKAEGVQSFYDEDGKIYTQKTYVADRAKKIIYYDKKGKEIGNYLLGKTTQEITEYYPNGRRSAIGEYENGERSGDWKFYSENGGWTTVKARYRRDELSGSYTEFFPNGKEELEVDYYRGREDGYKKTYYANGLLSTEGWMVEDEREGDWYYYNERGVIVAHLYFIDDQLHGYQDYFDNKGRRSDEYFIREGLVWTRTQFDSTGTAITKYVSDNGTGTFVSTFSDGRKWLTQEYKNGYQHGATLRYNYKDVKVLETQYVNGQEHGRRTEYFEESGKLLSEADIAYGDEEGKRVSYYENGNKRRDEFFISGVRDGVQKYYHENGQLEREGTWHMGDLDGEYKTYADDGSLMYVRYYDYGVLLGYSYLDKEGKMLPMIELEKASGKFESFYQNGNKSFEGEYENGRLNGHALSYYPDGKISDDENYEFGDFVGVQKYYYKNGNIESENNYFSDAFDGWQKYYYEDGKLKREEYYLLDGRFGNWKFYKADGTLDYSRLYYDSRPLSQTTPAPLPAEKPKGKPKGK